MQKTEKLGNLLTELIRTNHLEPKILEQKVFDLWRKHFGAPLGEKTIPVSLSNGILKVYTEYPPYRRELLFLKQRIIANLNAELGQAVLTDLRIELRQVRAVTPRGTETKQSEPHPKPSNPSNTHTTRRPTPEELEQIEQTLASVTDARLRKSLRQLFITQSEDKP
jgi:predicted nucleic acid-binding Zn ribbon protein